MQQVGHSQKLVREEREGVGTESREREALHDASGRSPLE